MRAAHFTRILLLASLGPGSGLPRAWTQDTLNPPAPLPEGVDLRVHQAIEKGLKYLASIQETNGSFGATPDEPRVYPVAVSGLVGLAFLAHGDTPTRGEYADAVDRVTKYLLSTSRTNLQATSDSAGLFTTGLEDEESSRKGPRPMYGHAFAMTFLAHVFGQEGDLQRREQIRLALKRGIELTRRVQTDEGGWGYRAAYWEDEGTLTVTQLQALRSCRDAGIFVEKRVIDRGMDFIEKSMNADGSVRYRVDSSEIRPGVTCASYVALWHAGEYDSDRIKRIGSYINRYVRHRWDSGKHAEYVEFYLAQAKWLMGGSVWSEYYKTASVRLASLQEPNGSWEGPDTDRYGTTYATAIALMVLQLPYNRLPVFQR